ncbi:hypothetical protein [Microbacterium sp. EST19A]|uniref:HAAS signaling domain-containing protein n=1 Tax=Microbacterium sp. EST19A TaxID=2862681 RepID=UPI001CBCDA3E|nr:hypothetical protein [Microbacterium sp. EST19A]
MTENTPETVREDYLARLDAAMRDLPHGVAADIRDGIAEELHGLDDERVIARIAQLGDPREIAREAQREVPGSGPEIVVPSPSAPPARRRGPATATRGFAITAALTLSFGGFIVPMLGWIVGVGLVTSATLWKRWEKLVAIAVPVVVTGLSLLISSLVSGFSGGGDPGGGTANNPLVPGLAGWHLLILLGFLLIPASGLWLLWRLRGRDPR